MVVHETVFSLKRSSVDDVYKRRGRTGLSKKRQKVTIYLQMSLMDDLKN